MYSIASMSFGHLPFAAYILIWWAAHLAAQLLTSHTISDGVHGLFLLVSTFMISSLLGSFEGTMEKAKLGAIAPNLRLCLNVSNIAGNLFLYNSMMHIPAYCSQSIKALEVVFTIIFTCMLQRRSIRFKETLGCIMIFSGLFALGSTTRNTKKPLCEAWNVGVLEVFMASTLLPVRNILLKQHVAGVLPYYGFVYLCGLALPWVVPTVLVYLVALVLLRKDSLTFTNTMPQLVAWVVALAITGIFFYVYNWASLRVLGTRGVSVQFHAGLNALKRGVTIALLYSVRLYLRPRLQWRGADSADGNIDSRADGIDAELFGTDHTMLSLALVLMVGGCFVTSSGNEGGSEISKEAACRSDVANGIGIESTKLERNMAQRVRGVCYTVTLLCVMSTLGVFFEDGVESEARPVLAMFGQVQHINFDHKWFAPKFSSNSKKLSSDENALAFAFEILPPTQRMDDQPSAYVDTTKIAEDSRFGDTLEKMREVGEDATANGKSAETSIRIMLINHTGKQDTSHFGQVGASYVLEFALMSHFGLETKVNLYPAGYKGELDTSGADLVVCNAEGTLHDKLNLSLLKLLWQVVTSKKRLWIVNFSFFYENRVAGELRGIFEHAEFISLRESMSEKLFIDTFPNISFHSAADLTFLLPTVRQSNVLMLQKYDKTFTRPMSAHKDKKRLLVTGCGGCKPYPISKLKGFALTTILPGKGEIMTPCEAANLMVKSKLLISSRFHATAVATSNLLPSISFSANTDKLKAIIRDLNSTCAVFLPEHVLLEKKYLRRLSKCEFEPETISRVREAAKRNFPFHVDYPTLCSKREMRRQKLWLKHLTQTDVGTTFTFRQRFRVDTLKL